MDYQGLYEMLSKTEQMITEHLEPEFAVGSIYYDTTKLEEILFAARALDSYNNLNHNLPGKKTRHLNNLHSLKEPCENFICSLNVVINDDIAKETDLGEYASKLLARITKTYNHINKLCSFIENYS